MKHEEIFNALSALVSRLDEDMVREILLGEGYTLEQIELIKEEIGL